MPRRMKVRPQDLRSSPPRVELVVDGPLEAQLTSINVRRDDKAAFDQVQGWLTVRLGKRVSQWEVFTVLLAEATANREGVLRGLESWA